MQNVNKSFLRYVLPSLLSFALSGVYTIVDGCFIGNRMGDLGIAAITLGYPVTALIQAAGTGIGLAGAIRYAILSAQGEDDKANYCLGVSSAIMLLVSAVIICLVLVFLYPLLGLLGAEGAVVAPTAEYVRWIVLGTVFQILGTGLVPFIRNMGGATFSMVAMLSGFAGNIVFDWLFVWKLGCGMAGAAWATVAGQALAMLLSMGYLIRNRAALRLPPSKNLPDYVFRILKISLAPFGLVLAPNVTMLFMNRFLLTWGGEQALAAYGCIGYLLVIVLLLLQGLGDGCQPLISWYYGDGDRHRMLQARRLAYISGFVIALGSVVFFWLIRYEAGHIFGASESTSLVVARVLPWFMAAMPLEAFTRVCCAYLYATEKSLRSYVLVYAEPVLVLLLLIILPRFMGLLGVWQANPLARLIAALTAAAIKIADDRQLKKSC